MPQWNKNVRHEKGGHRGRGSKNNANKNGDLMSSQNTTIEELDACLDHLAVMMRTYGKNDYLPLFTRLHQEHEARVAEQSMLDIVEKRVQSAINNRTTATQTDTQTDTQANQPTL